MRVGPCRRRTGQNQEAAPCANDPRSSSPPQCDPPNLVADSRPLAAMRYYAYNPSRRSTSGIAGHGDLCRDNVIRREGGGLCMIDSDTLSVAPVEFDLARTCYMSDSDVDTQRRYLAAYASAAGMSVDASALAWWEPIVWAQSCTV